jgi:hypothetical protein
VGTGAVFESGSTNYISVAFDLSNNKIVIAYSDGGNSGYGTAIVGTVDSSDNSISFGTAVVFGTGTLSEMYQIAFDSNSNRVVIAYSEGGNSNYGTAIVGTVSGTSISFGTAVVFESAYSAYINTVFDSNSNKAVIAYQDYADSQKGKAVVGTVSGTSISFGSVATFATAATGFISSSFDSSNNKVVIAYQDAGNSNHGTAIVGTVSGTSISFGSEVVFEAARTYDTSCTFDSNSNKIVIAYTDQDSAGSNTRYGTAIVGTVSGTSISFGTAVVFQAARAEGITALFDSNSNKVVIGYKDAANSSKPTAIVGTVSGTSISFGSEVLLLDAAVGNKVGGVFDSNSNKIVFAFRTTGDDTGNSVVYAPVASTNLTSENYIGMSGGVVDVAANVPQVIGTPSQFESGNTVNLSSTYDAANDKVVFAYRDSGNSNRGTAVVGTVSGTSITFGTPVVFATGTTYSVAITYDSTAEKVVVVYRDNSASDNGKARVGTVSGTSISFGSQVTFASAATYDVSATFDSSADKVVAVYMDGGNSNYGTAIVGTVSGTSISFGSEVVFSSSSTSLSKTATVFDSTNNKVVIAYRDVGDSDYGKAIVGTVSGTSISFGSASTFASAQSLYVGATYDSSAGKVVAAYVDGANSSYGTAVVGTVSGTSISFGSEVVFNSASTEQTLGPSYDATANRVVIAYQNAGDSNKGTLAVGTVSGTSIEFEAPVVFETAEAKRIVSVYDPDAGKIVIGYSYDAGGAVTGKAIVSQTGYQDITRGSVADGDNATIDIVGTVSTNQVGLTPGQQYYVQTDGTIGTTPADPSVLAGTAVSATKMVVKS